MSDDFNRGLRGENYTGGNYDEWLDGHRIYNGGGGGSGCLIIGLVLAFGSLLVAPIITAVISSIVLCIIFKIKNIPFTLKKIFLSSYITTLVYTLTSLFFLFALIYIADYMAMENRTIILWSVVILQIISFIITVFVLKIQLYNYTGRYFNFLRSSIFVLLVIVDSLAIISWIMYKIMLSYNVINDLNMVQ